MLYLLIVFFEALFFIYVAYLAGRLFLKVLGVNFSTPESNIKYNIYAILCGYGVYIFLGFIIALFGIFSAIPLWLFTCIIFIFSLPTLLIHFRVLNIFLTSPGKLIVNTRKIFQDNTLLKFIIVSWLVVNSFLIFVPITSYDTLDYHLPIMLDIIKEKKLTFTPEIRQYNFLPVFGEIFYAVPMVMFGEATEDMYHIFDYNNTTQIIDRKQIMSRNGPFTFQVLQYSVIILLTLLFYAFLRPRLKNKFLIPVAILFILSIFDLWREVLHSGYIDVIGFIFGIASLLIIIENCCEDKIKWNELMVSAFFLGIALGVKYLALFFGFINLFCLIFLYKKQNITLKRSTIKLLKYGCVLLIVSSFFYFRNLIQFGNPVYPMFNENHFTTVVNEFLLERTFANYLIFPFYRYSRWLEIPSETSSRLIVVGYYALLYVLGTFLAIKNKFTTVEKLLMFSTFTLSVLLFLSSHIYRFNLPLIILITPLLALFIDKFYTQLEESTSPKIYQLFKKISMGFICIGFLAVFLYGNFHYFKVRFTYIIGQYDTQEYIKNVGSQ